jgi:hypothetical protein
MVTGAFFSFCHAQAISTSSLIVSKPFIPFESSYILQPPPINVDSIYLPRHKNDSISFKINLLEKSAEKYFVTRKLFGVIFSKSRRANEDKIIISEKATDKYLPFGNRTLRNISITRLAPFGPSVFDSVKNGISSLEKVGNILHIKTLEITIRNSLLVAKGDTLLPRYMAESEDFIRKLPYISDVAIVITPINNTNEADIEVIVMDKWSIAGNISVTNSKQGNIEVFDNNIGGTGLGILGKLHYDYTNGNSYGRELELFSKNPLGYKANSTLKVRNGLGYDNTLLSVDKIFATTKTKWAGGFSFQHNSEPLYLQQTGIATSQSYRYADTWFGLSFNQKNISNLSTPVKYSITIAYKYKTFFNRPITQIDSNLTFQNRNLYLVGLSLSKHETYRDNFLYNFGTTEDVPSGFLAQLVGGYEFGEFENRPYVGTELSLGKALPLGYIQAKCKIGGYPNENNLSQGVFSLHLQYHTKKIYYSNWLFRMFFDGSFIKGINRTKGEGEYLYFQNTTLGSHLNYLYGKEKLNANIKVMAYSPLKVIGFKFAFYGFTDCLALKTSNSLFGSNSFALGFGMGVKIRNDNLVFNTFSLQLGYYPIVPLAREFTFYNTGSSNGKLYDFRPQKPDLIEF